MWTNSNNTLKHFSHVNVIHILGGRRWQVYNVFWEFDILINYIIIFKLPRSYGVMFLKILVEVDDWFFSQVELYWYHFSLDAIKKEEIDCL
jgi:hypothetical protein